MDFLKKKSGITAVFAVILVLTSFLVAVKFLSGMVEEHYESIKTMSAQPQRAEQGSKRMTIFA